jgi:hypothetical protein
MEALDIRFPTSHWLTGSDAKNPDPDYSAAYVMLHGSHDDRRTSPFLASQPRRHRRNNGNRILQS